MQHRTHMLFFVLFYGYTSRDGFPVTLNCPTYVRADSPCETNCGIVHLLLWDKDLTTSWFFFRMKWDLGKTRISQNKSDHKREFFLGGKRNKWKKGKARTWTSIKALFWLCWRRGIFKTKVVSCCCVFELYFFVQVECVLIGSFIQVKARGVSFKAVFYC